MIFTQPEFKKKYYLLRAHNTITYDLHDVYINNIMKLEAGTGYLLAIHINDTSVFKTFDENAVTELSANSKTWFKNELSIEDLNKLYKPSICMQNNTIQVILSDKSKIYVNNKLQDISECIDKLQDMAFLRKCAINLSLQHHGLYVYSKLTSNKWIIKCLNIYQDDDISAEEKTDIDESWQELVSECNLMLDNKIRTIQHTKTNISSLYQSIITEKNKKVWEDKIGRLKKLIQNIIF